MIFAFRRRASEVLSSRAVFVGFFLLATLISLFRIEVFGVFLFLSLISLCLVLADDFSVTVFPLLLLSLFTLKCYDSFDDFMVLLPFGIVFLASFCLHFALSRAAFSIGKSFWGIVFVALAVTVGGAFSITAREYLAFSSLYYIIGLGVGMVLLYLIMRREFSERARFTPERLLLLFYLAGCFGVWLLFSHIALSIGEIRAEGFYIQWSNNLSTMMLFFLPAPFYFALTRSRWHFVTGLVFYLTIALTGSRGGFLMGGILLLFLFVYVSRRDRRLLYASLATAILTFLALFFFRGAVLDYFRVLEGAGFISSEEARAKLLVASLRDFFSAPIFGKGMGYQGNQNIYLPVKGAANWYHMMIPQIIGSFGLVGVFAYGYQFYTRLFLIAKTPGAATRALGLSYGGILLMSQVNPGEFCPIPYELLTVILFILLELSFDTQTKKLR